MIITVNSAQSAVVKLFEDDMKKYSLSFSAMCLSDSATRNLLRDLFGQLEEMGMPVRHSRLTVECAEGGDAPVTLIVTAAPKQNVLRYVFFSSGDVAPALSAFLGKYVAEGTASLSFDSGRWLVELDTPVCAHDMALLAEFCQPLGSADLL